MAAHKAKRYRIQDSSSTGTALNLKPGYVCPGVPIPLRTLPFDHEKHMRAQGWQDLSSQFVIRYKGRILLYLPLSRLWNGKYGSEENGTPRTCFLVEPLMRLPSRRQVIIIGRRSTLTRIWK